MQERLLGNMLPGEVGSSLRHQFQDVMIECPDVIVLSADLTNFTAYSSNVSAGELVNFLNETYTAFDALADEFHMTKIKTIGDAVILASGIHGKADLSACVKMAISMRSTLHTITAKYQAGIDIRIGIARGACSTGVVGELRPKFDIWGPAVAAAERIERQAARGTIALSSELQAQLVAMGDEYDLDGANTKIGEGTLVQIAVA